MFGRAKRGKHSGGVPEAAVDDLEAEMDEYDVDDDLGDYAEDDLDEDVLDDGIEGAADDDDVMAAAGPDAAPPPRRFVPAQAGIDGPYDVADAPTDDVERLDLGSVRILVPDGTQLQIETDPEAQGVRAVHLLTPLGQFTINAYAAPRSGGLWREIVGELAEQLRADGAKVTSAKGPWGQELAGSVNDVALRFIGVDRPRWLLRGVVAGPVANAEESVEELREILRGTIVVRGDAPMPVRTPLPIELPEPIVGQLLAAQEQQA